MSLEALRSMCPWPEQRPDVPPSTHGWFFADDAKMVKHCLDTIKPQLILELGSWLGKSTRFMLDTAPQATVIAVDHWMGDACIARRHKIPPNLYEMFLSSCWEYRQRLIPLRRLVLQGMQEIHALGLRPGFIYVDAMHDYPSAFGDTTTALRLFPEAVIAGDDWNYGGPGFPVRRAVIDAGQAFNRRARNAGDGWCYEFQPRGDGPTDAAAG